MRIRQKTESLRAVLQGIIAPILEPEVSAPPGSYRRVQILVPASPLIVISIDTPTALEAGPSRTFMLPPMPPSTMVSIVLLPEQSLHGATESGDGYALLGLFVEYLQEGGA